MTCEYISASGARRPLIASISDGRAGGLKTVKGVAAQQVVTIGEGAGIVDRHTLN